MSIAIRGLIIVANCESTAPKRTCKILSIIARRSLSMPSCRPS
ncbi:hypothetical protein [Trichormus variabilis]|nr:hypothetical protein [Trichormus variabilis]